jgi:UDP-3-O-[3-hydroxymyristoyl] N-acetylglucosamine deacetylase
MEAQRTLKRSVSCAGIGLHSGKKVSLSLKPAPAGTGIRFRRTDLGGVEIPARADFVGAVAYATQLKAGEATVETVEHLLAALAASRIDNVVIELNTREVPIMDGSSAPFIYLIQEAGVKTLGESRRYLKVTRPVVLSRGDKQIALYPSEDFRVSYTIGFDHPLLRHQACAMTITEDSFVEQIAPARTFTFLKEVEMLRQNGLALGGSLDNAIVVGDTGVLNSSLRFDDEFVRHKVLDLVGDLSLVGFPVVAHAVVHRGGHALHTAMASHLLSETSAWQLVSSPAEVPVGVAAAAVPVTY